MNRPLVAEILKEKKGQRRYPPYIFHIYVFHDVTSKAKLFSFGNNVNGFVYLYYANSRFVYENFNGI